MNISEWQGPLLIACMVGAAIGLTFATTGPRRKRPNRRRRGVLGEPSIHCQRNKPEAPC